MNKTNKVSGLDVHKDSIFCALYGSDKHGEVKEYKTDTPAIEKMGAYLKKEGVVRIAMESTSIYWIPIWNILEEMGFELLLVNPFQIKQMPGKKSDIKDAQWIAELLHKDLIKPSLVPDKKIRELRCYTRKYMKLQGKMTRAYVQIDNVMQKCGIRFSNYVSSITSKSYMAVARMLASGEDRPNQLMKQVHGRIKNRHGLTSIRASLTGCVQPQHRFELELLLQELDLLISHSESCSEKMVAFCEEHYQQEQELLMTLPGVKRISAIIIIAETGADMGHFATPKHFSGWTGLRPRNDESAGKYKSVATTKGNKYLRAILVQIAWAAARTKGSEFREKFNRLIIRKPRKKALVAVARKLGVLIWIILKNKQEYNQKRVIILDPKKLKAKMAYHNREAERLKKMCAQQ